MTYGSQVEMGLIPFPTKLYGNRLYPAGDYEGLLITLGAGQGENWWCVLFPPLCFVDFGSGEALVDENESDAEDQNSSAQGQEEEQKEIEVRFFLVELFMKIKNYFI
jgi:stage II sporulation protein R